VLKKGWQSLDELLEFFWVRTSSRTGQSGNVGNGETKGYCRKSSLRGRRYLKWRWTASRWVRRCRELTSKRNCPGLVSLEQSPTRGHSVSRLEILGDWTEGQCRLVGRGKKKRVTINTFRRKRRVRTLGVALLEETDGAILGVLVLIDPNNSRGAWIVEREGAVGLEECREPYVLWLVVRKRAGSFRLRSMGAVRWHCDKLREFESNSELMCSKSPTRWGSHASYVYLP